MSEKYLPISSGYLPISNTPAIPPPKSPGFFSSLWEAATTPTINLGPTPYVWMPSGPIPVPPSLQEATGELLSSFTSPVGVAGLAAPLLRGPAALNTIRAIGGLQAASGAEKIARGEEGGYLDLGLGSLPFIGGLAVRRVPKKAIPIQTPAPVQKPEVPLEYIPGSRGRNTIVYRGASPDPIDPRLPKVYTETPKPATPEEVAFNALIPERLKPPFQIGPKGETLGPPNIVLEGENVGYFKPVRKGLPIPEPPPKPTKIQPAKSKMRKDLESLIGSENLPPKLESLAKKADEKEALKLALKEPKAPKKAELPKVALPFKTPEEAVLDWDRARKAADIEGRIVMNRFEKYRKLGIEGFERVESADDLKEVRDFLNQKFEQTKDLFPWMSYRRHYLPHIWKEPPEVVNAVLSGGKRVSRTPGFTLQRIIDDYKRGIAAGLTPKFDNLADLLGWFEQRVNKAIADRNLFLHLKNNNVILPASSAPEGWKALNPNHFPVISKGDQAWFAPPKVAEVINNALDSGDDILSKVGRAFAFTKNMALTGGIPGTGLNWHGLVNIPARVAASAGLAHPAQAISNVARALSYAAVPKLAERSLNKALPRAAEWAKHGLQMGVEGFWEFQDKTKPKGVFSRIEDAFSATTFGKVIPLMKMTVAEQVKSRMMKSGLPEEQAMKYAAQFTNNVTGGIEKITRSPQMRAISNIIFLAPDWLETKYNLGKGALAALKNPNDPLGRAYLNMAASAAAAFAVAAAIRSSMNVETRSVSRAGNIPMPALDTPEKQAEWDMFGAAFDFIELPLKTVESFAKGEIPVDVFMRFARYNTSIPIGILWDFIRGEDIHRNPLSTRDRYGRPVPRSELTRNILSELINFWPQPVQSAIDVSTGKITPLEGVSQALEIPVRWYRKPKRPDLSYPKP